MPSMLPASVLVLPSQPQPILSDCRVLRLPSSRLSFLLLHLGSLHGPAYELQPSWHRLLPQPSAAYGFAEGTVVLPCPAVPAPA